MAPRWVVRLLGRIVDAEEQDDVIGDLEELHGRRAARWGALVAKLITGLEGTYLFVVLAVRRGARLFTAGAHLASGAELRLALRLVRKQPVMTLTAVVALGVGIGMVSSAASVFQQVLYSDLPFENGDRWVSITTLTAESRERSRVDLERLRAFRASAPAFAYIGGTESSGFNVVLDNGEVERVPGARVTPGTFGYLPYVPLLGRILIRDDGLPGAEPVALIRESLWVRRFSRSPDVLGLPIGIAGRTHVVVGVLPDDSGYPSKGEIWLPLEETTFGALDDRAPIGPGLVGILSEDATPEEARVQLQLLSDGVSAPGRGAEAQTYEVTPVTRMLMSPQIQVGVTVFMTILILVLVVIAANVSNLVVARTSRRSAEFAVRTALGASRGRLVVQLFLEVLVIGAFAASLGLGAAYFILEGYNQFFDELPFWVDIGLDPTTAIVVIAAALFASGVVGIVPALRATGKHPGDALRSAGRGASLGISRFGRTMIAAEVALSVTLLGIALTFANGFQLYVTPEFALPDDRVLTARLFLDIDDQALPTGGARTVADSAANLTNALEQSLAALPGVLAVSSASNLPRSSPYPEPLEIEGRPELVSSPWVAAGPALFDVLEVEPLVGRGIEESDLLPESPRVVVVNVAFALEHFGTQQVVGQRIRLVEQREGAEPRPWSTIVGVVPSVMEVIGAAQGAGVYEPMGPRTFVSLAVRVDRDPLAYAGRLRRAAFDLDPNLNVSQIVRLADVGAENRKAFALMGSAMTGVGLITLLLALAGVYSIVSLTVTQRTREIGLRVALGASQLSITWSLLRQLGLLVVAGAVVGAIAGHQVAKIRLFVFAVPEGQWWLFPVLVSLMAAAGLAACWIPARRALGIHPVEALKADR